jgi:preprotein translocase subunit SecG
MRAYLLPTLQILLSALLMASILMQQRGSAVGGTFGGGGEVFRTKRGIEKGLFYATIVLAILFFLTAIASAILG